MPRMTTADAAVAILRREIGSMTLAGKVEGDKVSFSMEVPGPGLTLTFTGTVEGDKMSGSTDHAGNWTATRQ